MDEKTATLQQWVNESNSIVFFSGPGVSEESGIPDFRRAGEDHFEKYQYPPETILTRTFFERKPEEFFQYYRERMLEPLTKAEPNATHNKLAELHAAGKLRRIITSNMDELHQEAGCRNVFEIYGSMMRTPCPKSECERRITVYDVFTHPGIPYCDVDMCGAVMTPEIHLYGDGLDKELMTQAVFDILMCDLLIVAGTSLTDYPAAALVYYYWKKKMVLLNEKDHPSDTRADLVIHAPVSEIMGQILI